MTETREILLRTPGATPNEQALVPLAGVKDFYARDTDPGAVGAGSVWKDTSAFPAETWWVRNATNDGWLADFLAHTVAVGDDDAQAALVAESAGAGDALSTLSASANGAGGAKTTATAYTNGVGTADARPTAIADNDGQALSGPRSTSHGIGTADASPTAVTDGAGDAYAANVATATGAAAEAHVEATAESDTGGAFAGSIAVRQGMTAGMQAEVDDNGVAKLGFNGIGPSAIPELPATPTEQDIADVLVALGLVTQAA